LIDIHHIDARGMGGRKSADKIENLMALTRELHTKLGDIKKWKPFLKAQHKIYLETGRTLYEREPRHPFWKGIFLRCRFPRLSLR
jgi:hypothetical protein